MIADRHVAHRIAIGEIRQYRVPADHEPLRRGRRITIVVHRAERAFDPACQVVVTSCTRSTRNDEGARGHEATLADGNLAELGHDTLIGYVRAWLLERDAPWLARRCTGPSISTVNDAEDALEHLDDQALMARWRDRWADRSVWVVTWETVNDDTVWLMSGTGAERYRKRPDGRVEIDDTDRGLNDHGYTLRPEQALLDAGAVIDPGDLDPSWARQAAARHRVAEDGRDGARRLARGLR